METITGCGEEEIEPDVDRRSAYDFSRESINESNNLKMEWGKSA